jgi:hypothetical protein
MSSPVGSDWPDCSCDLDSASEADAALEQTGQ